MNTNAPLLIKALRLNALFSGACGGLLLLAAPWVAAQLGLPDTTTVYLTAVILIGFSIQLANIVRTGRIRTWEIAGIIGGDLAWVIGSIVLVALFHQSLTPAGLVLVDLAALAVLFFAIQQIRGLKAFRQNVPA